MCELELQALLAAVDIAEPRGDVADREERKAAVVGALVFLADAHHVLKTRLRTLSLATASSSSAASPVNTIQHSPGFQPESSNLGFALSSAHTSLSRDVQNHNLPSSTMANENGLTRG